MIHPLILLPPPPPPLQKATYLPTSYNVLRQVKFPWMLHYPFGYPLSTPSPIIEDCHIECFKYFNTYVYLLISVSKLMKVVLHIQDTM